MSASFKEGYMATAGIRLPGIRSSKRGEPGLDLVFGEFELILHICT